MLLSENLALALEIASVAFALAYLLLAIRQSLWCWPAALISVVLAMLIFFNARLYMESVLQIFYFAMGVYGWLQWRRGVAGSGGKAAPRAADSRTSDPDVRPVVAVHWWPMRMHLWTLGLVLVASAIFGRVLSATDAAFPYLDSFTTVAAIVATFMVAHKVMENWHYWFLIDSILVYLYLARGLNLYAGLYVLYLVLIVLGFRAWQRDLRSQAVTQDEAAVA